MARRSREDMEAERLREEQSQERSTVYSTAIYVRLSVENSGKSQEKDVITNQIQQCKDFLNEKPELNLVNIYSDNGKTGTNFQRDGFQNLLRDIDNGIINAVIVRDFSRFGRNRLECVRFLSNVFPQLGVRFISINECYDSLTDDDSALKILVQSLVNEMYSKDVSRKMCVAYKTQFKEGTFRNRNLPYGYMWNETRDSIVLDEEVSDYVKMIFQWRLENVPVSTIARNLDELDAPLPERRKFENGVRNGLGHTAPKWSGSTVYSMLENPNYTGDTVFGRYETALYKNQKSSVVKDEEKWFVFPNTHPALVSKIDFEKIQELLQESLQSHNQKLKETQKEREKIVNLFSDKMFCSDCGKKMYFKKTKHISSKEDDVELYYTANYKCSTFARLLTPPCTSHCISQTILEEKVLSAIKTQVKVALDYEILLDKLRNSVADTSVREKQNALISSLTLKVNGARKRLSSLYQDYVEEILSKDEYLFAKERYSDELSFLELRLSEARQQKEEFCEAMSSDNKWITLMKSVSKKKKLSQALVDNTIEKVLVYEHGNIEVVMKFNDVFRLMNSCIATVENEVTQ